MTRGKAAFGTPWRSALWAWLLLAGCGGEPVVRHPVSLIQDRYRPRIDLVEFVVKDPERQAQVIRIYRDIEELTFAWHRARLERRATLLAFEREGEPEGWSPLEARLRRGFGEGRAFHERYVELQMELRSVLTREEFERLDAIR